MKPNIPDFDVSPKRVSNTKTQFLEYKLWLLVAKTFPNSVEIDYFLCDLYSKQLFKLINFKMSHGNEINNSTITSNLIGDFQRNSKIY